MTRLSSGPGTERPPTGPRPAKTKNTGTDKALPKEKPNAKEFIWLNPNGSKMKVDGHIARKLARAAENLLGYNPLDLEPNEGITCQIRKVQSKQISLFPIAVN